MSALQLPVGNAKSNAGSSAGSGSGMKRRRHSNATALYKGGASGVGAPNHAHSSALAAAAALASGQQPTVRRIKSTALEISCPRPSVSNLSPHPNSVEAINGQQMIKNPQSALLPPPSKCLVRNPHLNLCPKFGGSFGGASSSSGGSSSLHFGTSGSTTALIEPVSPIVEQSDERASSLDVATQRSECELDLNDVEADDFVDEDEDEDVEDIEEGNEEIDIELDDLDDDEVDIVDDEVDDEVDDVPMHRRRKALGCLRHRVESDVGNILGDEVDNDEDDEFRDFDDDLEQGLSNAELKSVVCEAPPVSHPKTDFTDDFDHILNGLEQIQQDLKRSAAENNRKAHVYAADSEDEVDERSAKQRQSLRSPTAHAAVAPGLDDEQPSTSQTLRQRLHSTDSETDNNGSRSPLLSGKSWQINSSKSKAAEQDLYMEVSALQKHKNLTEHHVSVGVGVGAPQHAYEMRPQQAARGEGDSGCPSSDCEQVSASSKDMLLAGMEAAVSVAPPKSKAEPQKANKDVEEGLECGKKTTTSAGASGSKNLGAIPKVVKYREVNETINGGGGGGSQLHKRRGGSSGAASTNNEMSLVPYNAQHSITSKAASRTSSSTSSRSISADSFSADIHKMLWLMTEHGRPEAAQQGYATANSAATGATSNVISGSAGGCSTTATNMSTAHFQFYQDAIQALNTYPATSTDSLWLTERMYYRDKARRNSKQVSEPGNSSIGDFSHAHELQSAQLSSQSGATTAPIRSLHPPLGVVVASSSLNARTVYNGAGLSIQGLINVLNDEGQQRSSQARSGSGSNNTGTGTGTRLLNGRPIESYFRPSFPLSAEKPVAPKSYYKYRFKCCGYEHEFKISMDRLELLALFDRDLHWLHIMLSVLLGAMSAYLGATILQLGYYKDLFAFLFCAVIASAQYSLVKSVQPDAASPIHGFNKTVAYSRAIYFCICSGILLLCERLKREYEQKPMPPAVLSFFGVRYSPLVLTATVLQVMYVFLLCFPIIFSLGLFPQINTFLMYLLEQIDMHVFGGNAAGSLLGK